MIGFIGILLALGGLIFLAYRGISVLILGPIMALVATAFSGVPLLASYTQVFMPALGNFVIAYFPLFLLGAIFGRLMDDSGFAHSIADGIIRRLGPEQAILATVLACAALTYGGVSLFVVAFAIYPVANALFKDAGISKRLLPASIALGAFTFTMTAMPGTPAIQNAIPMPFFGTTPFASPIIGVIAALVMFGGGLLWLKREAKRSKTAGVGYGDAEESDIAPVREQAHDKGYDIREVSAIEPQGASPAAWLSAVPIILVITVNYLLSVHVFPALDTSYLATERFGETRIDALRGIWSIIISLTIAILFILVLRWRILISPKNSMIDGANASVLPIFNTASLVGFGAVVAALPAFSAVSQAIESIDAGPVVSLAISTAVLAGLTGSASGGMTIALDSLGADYLARALQEGIDPSLLHRITSLATGSLDALPHNGAVVTLLAICGLSHREAYGPIFMVAVLIPVIAVVIAIILGSTFGSF